MTYMAGNKKVSTHPIDKDTTITLVGTGLLLLEDTNMVAATLLDDRMKTALVTALKVRLYIQVLDDAVE
jgi:hypothetical protein